MTQIEDSLDDIVLDLNTLIPIITGVEDRLSSNLSNPNLLDNPDFAIDQRGMGTLSSGPAYSFVRDRWKGTYSSIDFSITDRVITTNTELYHHFEANIWSGLKLTISVSNPSVDLKIKLGSGSVAGVIAAGSGVQSITLTGSTASSDIGKTFYIVANSGNGNAYSFSDLKVEFGEIATPFAPPYSQVELAKCQRHYEKITFTHLYIGQGDGIHNYRQILFRVQKANVPSIVNNLAVISGAAISVELADVIGARYGRAGDNSAGQ